ncbi:MAG: bifunctional riboflavin kinase/FAD synthetase [Candidatus Acidiferrales bacterium]
MPLAILHSPEAWITQFGASREDTSLTIGNFDGVHLGHQKIIGAVVEKARGCHLKSAVVTFDPHPSKVLKPDSAPTMLESIDQRCRHFADLGVDAVLILKFEATFAAVSAEEFVRRYLVEALRAREVFVGANFRFGQKQRGDVALLQALGHEADFAVNIVEPKTVDGETVSSSAIRQALRDGRVVDAERMLGRPFALDGEIVSGTGIGRKLVVPTLNLKTAQETLPKGGVYVTQSTLNGSTYGSVTNIGMRPTFDGTKLAIESYLFEFSEHVTRGPLEVKFLQRLRDEQKFAGPDALRTQVQQDIERAKTLYTELQTQ